MSLAFVVVSQVFISQGTLQWPLFWCLESNCELHSL